MEKYLNQHLVAFWICYALFIMGLVMLALGLKLYDAGIRFHFWARVRAHMHCLRHPTHQTWFLTQFGGLRVLMAKCAACDKVFVKDVRGE